MRLDGVLSQAASGLDSISRQLGLVGQNVANANSAGYTRETAALSSLTVGNEGAGVRSGIATRTVDAALRAELLAAGGREAGDALRSATLAAIDSASGAPGSGTDIASLVGNLRDGFSTLLGDPSNTTQQWAVVNAAGAVASGFNGLSGAINTARQSIQDGMTDDAVRANTVLREIGTLSDAIMLAKARGQTTAGLEDKRDAAMATASELTGARFLAQNNGDLLAVSGGVILPTRAEAGPFSVAKAGLSPATAAPPLLLNNSPVTLEGGRLGVAQQLRDTLLPRLQSGLDTLAQSLASGFGSAGLPLFTDAAGAMPASATGFSGTIRVSPAAVANPAFVRDGAASATTAGNPARIGVVLNTVLATGNGTVAQGASDLVATHARLAASAASQLDTQQGMQSALAAKLSAGTGVSVDTEMTSMIRLQNSYGANAKVMSAVQAMFNQLLEIVR